MGVENNPNFLINRHFFNNHLVIYVLSGTFCIEQECKTMCVPAGSSVLMTLTKPHKYYFKEKGEILWFHFRGTPIQSLISDLDTRGLLPAVTATLTELETVQQILQLRLRSQMSTALEQQLSGTLYQVVLQLSALCLDQVRNDDYWGFTQPHPYLYYLDSHLNTPLHLDEIAAHFHMSRCHFCHVFHKQFGMSPFTYLNNQKISLAKHLLQNTNESIANIANYLCFYDQGYFSRIFKKTVGMTPRQYRNSSRSLT